VSGLVLGLRFVLELAMLAGLALGGWGLAGSATAATGIRVVAAVAAPAAGAVVWGAWIAPKARRRLDDPARLALESVLFALGAGGFLVAGRPGTALAFAVLVAAHLVAMAALGIRGA
jgi:hypothetical protein